MTALRRLLVTLMIVVFPVHIAAVPVRHLPVPTRDWSQVVARLPSGAFVQGNPDAPVHLVEYLSLTCPHCAHFEAEAIAPLTAKYIRTGRVLYEVRHALRDPFDYAGSLLARCDGPSAFFTTLPRVFAQQESWFSRAQAWAQIEQAANQPADQILPKVAAGAGFDSLFGMTSARMDACLTNHDEQAVLTAMAGEAWNRPNFPGTPAFMINDVLKPDIRAWADLDAVLAAALHLRVSPGKTRHK